MLGASSKDKQASNSLEGLGYISSTKHEGERQFEYTITAAGRKALAAN
jgi:hypothetical protein